MKKLLGIVVLGLLWCNVGFARRSGEAGHFWQEGDGLNGWWGILFWGAIFALFFFGRGK